MDNLITSTAFTTHPVYLDLQPYGGDTHLDNIITTYQPQLLRKALGDLEYRKLENDVTGTTPASQQWIDFLSGTIYSVSGKTLKWNGFTHLLKYFIFYYFLRDITTQTHFQGNTIINIADFNVMSYKKKMAEVWNIGVSYWGYDTTKVSSANIEKTNNYYRTSAGISRYIDSDYYTNGDEYAETMFNFLNNNSSDYPDVYFTELETMNFIGF